MIDSSPFTHTKGRWTSSCFFIEAPGMREAYVHSIQGAHLLCKYCGTEDVCEPGAGGRTRGRCRGTWGGAVEAPRPCIGSRFIHKYSCGGLAALLSLPPPTQEEKEGEKLKKNKKSL